MKTKVSFMFLAATSAVQQYGEYIAVFPWQRFQYLLQCWNMYVKITKGSVFVFQWEQMLSERATILRFTYFAYFVHVQLCGTNSNHCSLQLNWKVD